MGAFLDRLEPSISRFDFTQDGALNAIIFCSDLLNKTLSAGDHKSAFAFLAREDLAEAQHLLNDLELQNLIMTFSNAEESLSRSLSTYVDFLKINGVDVGLPKLFFVKNFPPPYDSSPAFAMNIDKADAVACGSAEGIYFKIDKLRPLYSEFLLAHEIVHYVLGKADPLLIARGLEEGMCELIGSLLLSPLTLGMNISTNILLFNRIYPSAGNALDLYLPFLRQAYCVYDDLGNDGVYDILRHGRSHLKFIETKLMKCCSITDKGGKQISPEVILSLRKVCMLYNPSLILSPEAYIVASRVKSGMLIRELDAELFLDRETVRNALDELEVKFSYLSRTPDKTCIRFADAFENTSHSVLYAA